MNFVFSTIIIVKKPKNKFLKYKNINYINININIYYKNII